MSRPRKPRAEDGSHAKVDLARCFWGGVPFPKQRRFVTNTTRPISYYSGGRGAAKSTGLCQRAIFLALANPGGDGLLGGRTGPEIATRLLPVMARLIGDIKRESGVRIARFSKKDMAFTFIGGGRLFLRPYSLYESLSDCRGFDLCYCCLDEVEFARCSAHEIISVFLYALRSPLAKVRALSVSSSPDGMKGFVAYFSEQLAKGSKEHQVICATITDNPHITPEFIELVRAGSSKRQWEQEANGLILMPAHSVYGGDYDPAVHVIPWTWRSGSDWRYVIGHDPGQTRAAAVFIQVSPQGAWYVADEIVGEGLSFAKMRKLIDEKVDLIWRRYGQKPSGIALDRAVASERAYFRDAYSSVCEFGVRTCESAEEQRVLRGCAMVSSVLSPAVGEPRLYFADDLPGAMTKAGGGILYGMGAYCYQRRYDGTVTKNPVKDGSEDSCDALRYAIEKFASEEKLWGGKALPFLLAEDPHKFQEDRAARGREE